MKRLCIAALALATVLAGCSDDSEPARDAGATAVTTALTASKAPAQRTPVPLVLAGQNGVVFVPPDGEPFQVSTTPAAIAFGPATDTFVYQDAGGSPEIYPPLTGGPVRVWSGGKVRGLPANPNASQVRLLDARKVGDVPTVLVAERFDDDAPSSYFEELVAIDLRTDARRIIVRRPAWESGHEGGRLLPDGDVAGLFHSEASVLLARWSAKTHRAVWTEEIGTDMSADLLWRTGVLATVESAYDGGPVLTVTPRDLATGAAGPVEKVAVQDPDGTLQAGLFCMDWLSPRQLACARSDGAPVAISLNDRQVAPLPGDSGAVPTVIGSP
jgi:hypothetical protein